MCLGNNITYYLIYFLGILIILFFIDSSQFICSSMFEIYSDNIECGLYYLILKNRQILWKVYLSIYDITPGKILSRKIKCVINHFQIKFFQLYLHNRNIFLNI